jgi:hypothetical protein
MWQTMKHVKKVKMKMKMKIIHPPLLIALPTLAISVPAPPVTNAL